MNLLKEKQSQQRKPSNLLSRQERTSAIKRLRGKYRETLTPTEEFGRRKADEITIEQ